MEIKITEISAALMQGDDSEGPLGCERGEDEVLAMIISAVEDQSGRAQP